MFEAIQRKYDFLEFKYVGQYVIRPFDPYRIERRQDGTLLYLGRQVGEKGVDVGLSIDMVAKMQNYDAGILVSGDYDYLPAVAYIKNNLKVFYQFSLAKGVPPQIRHLSPWLRGMVDSFQVFDEAELLTGFLDRKSGIPSYILDAIDRRIEQLAPEARTIPLTAKIEPNVEN